MAIIYSALSLIVFFLPSRLDFKKAIRLVFIAVILLVALVDILPNLFMRLSESVESEDVSDRMEELSDMTSGKETSGDGKDRIYNWTVSYENFINNFMTGTGNESGAHSFVLDTMSLYGIWGAILIIIQFSVLFRIAIKPYLKSEYGTRLMFVFVLHFFVSFFNPHFYYNAFILFIPSYIRFHERTKSVILGRKTIK